MTVTQIRVEHRYGDLGMASLIVINNDYLVSRAVCQALGFRCMISFNSHFAGEATEV